MGTFKEVLGSDIKSQRSFLNQLIDVLQEDVSSSFSRRKYQQFVTGGIGPGVTSSLFQTVYDQDFSLQTANAILDMSVGLDPAGDIVSSALVGTDVAGKELFPSSSLMVREKMDIYRQFAGSLLGNVESKFTAPFDSTNTSDEIDAGLFLGIKRLFARDQLKRESFAMRFYQTASSINANGTYDPPDVGNNDSGYFSNISSTATDGAFVYTDIGSATNKITAFGGAVGNLVDASDTSRNVGLIFYDRGTVLLDLEKVTSGAQYISGTISAVTPSGVSVLGGNGTETARISKMIPDFMVSGSVDDIIDHIGGTRFGSGSLSALTFQNITNINSSLIFCRATADEFNYSSNPTYTDSEGRIVVIDEGQEDTQSSFTFVTRIGLYDSNSNLLAVASLSRPVEKNAERDLTLRVRLDY